MKILADLVYVATQLILLLAQLQFGYL